MLDWVKDGLSKAEVRAILAVLLVSSVIALSFLLVFVNPDMTQLVYTTIANMAFAVIAFYFGTKMTQSQPENQHTQNDNLLK